MKRHYEVAVVGGGISGCALFYQLARYTDVKSLALFEKYEDLATLNSRGECNSQTIHCGDIETNYDFEKAKKVSVAARMVVKYALMHGYASEFMFSHQKMVLGVGEEESAALRERFSKFREIYPYLRLFEKDELKILEPNVVLNADKSGDRSEEIVAMGVQSGEYTTIDFGRAAKSFVKNARDAASNENHDAEVFLSCEIERIVRASDGFCLTAKDGREFSANYVVVDAGAHSLFLAHKMGYGLDYSCLPVAGSFYMSDKRLLKGKVYMVQNPKLPFAALHGDADILADGRTRFGPTALMMPKLERYRGSATFWDFLKTLRFDGRVARSMFELLCDNEIRNYLFKNFAYEIPCINRRLFVKAVRKIVPSLAYEDVRYARNFGGVRPQVLDKTSGRLMLGEAGINTGEGISFNMTPSPGATSCMANALRDAREVCAFLGRKFNEDKFAAELLD